MNVHLWLRPARWNRHLENGISSIRLRASHLKRNQRPEDVEDEVPFWVA